MSKEYIDREEAIKILEQYDLSSGSTLGCHSGAIECAISAIEMLPAADVVEVVRCRECKYWGDEDGKLQRSDGLLFARCKIHNYLLDGRHTGWCPTENNFCSYGELKEGADNEP